MAGECEHEGLMRLIQVKNGDYLNKGTVIASGGTNIFHKTIRASREGRVILAGGGQVLPGNLDSYSFDDLAKMLDSPRNTTQIETDLRSLKQTVRLQHICAHSADMMEKELLVAVMAYNLVRAIMFQAAQRAQIDPRQLSFTYACNIVLDSYPKILAARTAKQQQQGLDRIIDLVSRCRLPKRTKRRSYPREVWGRGYRFPIKRREKN